MSTQKNIEDYLTDPAFAELYVEYRESAPEDITIDLLQYFTILSDLRAYTLSHQKNHTDTWEYISEHTWKYITDLKLEAEDYYYVIPGYLYLLKKAAGDPSDEKYNSTLDAWHTLFTAEHEYERAGHYISKPDPNAIADPSAPIRFQFTNNFDNVEPQKVFMHFKKGLVDTGHCELLVLGDYLIHAFEEQKIPEKKFNLSQIKSKKKITQLFYEYFELAEKPFGKAGVYAGLLGDYFEGFDTANVRTNFSKGSY